MNEAEIALQLKEAMRIYSQNVLSSEQLGIFKGVETEGVTVKIQLDGINLRITPVDLPDVSKYKNRIKELENALKTPAETPALEPKPPRKYTRKTTEE